MAKNILVLFISLAVSFIVLEGFSRLAFPIQYGNKTFDLSGDQPISIYDGPIHLKAGLQYRQITQEFDIVTSHTADGTRGPDAPEMPQLVFIGDSMTYGVGLADDQTIPHQVCQMADMTCANLGLPGSSTIAQLDRLEDILRQESWRPARVILMPNVMTTAFMGGNDLADNLRDKHARAAALAQPEPDSHEQAQGTSLMHTVMSGRYWLLEHINLARLTYYIFGPMLRQAFTPGLKTDERVQALSLMAQELTRLETLSQQYGFATSVYLVHPMQDIMRGSWTQTQSDMQSIADHVSVISTAPALIEYTDISDIYYPLDGHVTPEGATRIARLIAGDFRQPSQ